MEIVIQDSSVYLRTVPSIFSVRPTRSQLVVCILTSLHTVHVHTCMYKPWQKSCIVAVFSDRFVAKAVQVYCSRSFAEV